MPETATPRIAPVEPPYDDETADMLRKWMPPGADVEPLKLFRTLAVHSDLVSRYAPAGSPASSGTGAELTPREREIVIHRNVRADGSGVRVGRSCRRLRAPTGARPTPSSAATVHGGPDDPGVVGARRPARALCDELHATATVSDGVWELLAAEWPPDQLLEHRGHRGLVPADRLRDQRLRRRARGLGQPLP
jgi:hypothetical protein